MSALIGYARVSTDDQDTSIQAAQLLAAGCTVIRSEKRSGTSLEAREELQTILTFLREGDTLMVTRIDRLARSVADLQDIVRVLKSKGVALRATEQPIDTSTAAGKAFLDMLGVFAEFETNLRRERQMEGIAKAKAAGVYQGRKPTVPVEEVRRLHAEGVGPSAIAGQLSISHQICLSGALATQGVGPRSYAMRELQEFVARMARLSTPYDPDVMAKAHAAADPDWTDDEIISDLPNDFCFDEAQAFWRLIAEARTLLVKVSSPAELAYGPDVVEVLSAGCEGGCWGPPHSEGLVAA
jgi:DNA invertase Pin-like site-specific DNA recombinase